MAYKFEKLDVWQRALDYSDQIHEIADQLPKHERYNLRDQMTRAANSIALNLLRDDATARFQSGTSIFRWIEKRTEKITATRDDPQGPL